MDGDYGDEWLVAHTFRDHVEAITIKSNSMMANPSPLSCIPFYSYPYGLNTTPATQMSLFANKQANPLVLQNVRLL